MNLFKKALGLVAGSALALSLATGTFAAGETNADLYDNTNNPQCSGSAFSGNIDLGEWEWNGTSYALRSGSTSGNIQLTISQNIRATPNVTCNVTVTKSNLYLNGDVNSTFFIPSGNVNLTGSGGGASGAGPNYSVSTPAQPASQVLTLTALLSGVPTSLIAGAYSGTITITSPVAAP